LEITFSSGVSLTDSQLALVQHGFEFLEHRFLGQRHLVAALGVLGHLVQSLLHGFEIGEDEFGVDDFDVAHRIDGAGHVMDVRVFEAPHHLHDGVHLADVREELVAEPFARATRL
jgi:hypothetical protein